MIVIGARKVKPSGISTIILEALNNKKPRKFSSITLKNILYIPAFSISIISS